MRGDGCDCPDCDGDPCGCDVPAPTLKCDSVSASKTKCGFSEFTDAPSTPPKIYRTKSQTGTVNAPVYTGEVCFMADCEEHINTWSGSKTYARSSCSVTDTRKVTVESYYSDTCGDCGNAVDESWGADEAQPPATDPVEDYAQTLWILDSSYCESVAGYEGYDGPTVTNTQKTYNIYAGCSSGTVTVTLSDEYTTAELISDTESALSSYPGTWTGTCSSYRNLPTDETVYSIRRFKYKFLIPELPEGTTCYRITWKEGGTDKSYDWDGSATETPVYGPVLEPASNGSVAITDVVASYDCP